MIVAGLVPATTGSNTVANLGLVRYRPDGKRRAWTNPGIYDFFGIQYIVFPNTNTSPGNNSNEADVTDIKLFGNRIYVLTKTVFGANDTDVRVLIFDLSGQFLISTSAAFILDNESPGGIALSSNLLFPETITLAYVGHARTTAHSSESPATVMAVSRFPVSHAICEPQRAEPIREHVRYWAKRCDLQERI